MKLLKRVNNFNQADLDRKAYTNLYTTYTFFPEKYPHRNWVETSPGSGVWKDTIMCAELWHKYNIKVEGQLQ